MNILKLLPFCFVIFGNTNLFASTESVSTIGAINISQGDWSVSTNRMGFTYGSSEKFAIALDPRVEYFVANRLALGTLMQLDRSFGDTASTSFSAGPSVTYHFWNSRKFSSNVRIAYVFNNLYTNKRFETRSNSFVFGAGLNYNFSNWVGIGPSVQYEPNDVFSKFSIEAINLFFYI